MKKTIYTIFLILMLGLFIMHLASAMTEDCDIQVSLVNQDPLPAIPGDYVNVVFQVTGLEKGVCSQAMFKLNPTYPFSLDEESQTQTLQGRTWISSDFQSYWTIPYKLRVASDALDGVNELNVLYGENSLSLSKSFNISIEDSRTSFDAVIQEVSNSDVSIAIANIGKYTANSVVVRIPDQDNFKATDTNGQMVGSLDSGDYTIVSFALSKTMQRGQESSNLLQFDIYYTDALGERRIVNMELPVNIGSSSEVSTTGSSDSTTEFAGPYGRNMNQQTSFWSSNYVKGAIVFILIIVIFYMYKKYPQKFEKIKDSIKQKFHKNKSHSEVSKEIPSWIKNLEKSSKKKE